MSDGSRHGPGDVDHGYDRVLYEAGVIAHDALDADVSLPQVSQQGLTVPFPLLGKLALGRVFLTSKFKRNLKRIRG